MSNTRTRKKRGGGGPGLGINWGEVGRRSKEGLKSAREYTKKKALAATNALSGTAIKSLSKLKSSLKSDRLDALMKGAKVQTFCCKTSKDDKLTQPTDSMSIPSFPNLFGNNRGEDCQPVYSGQCNVRGLRTHKYRCFDSKYYPVIANYPGKLPDFPSDTMGLKLPERDIMNIRDKLDELKMEAREINKLLLEKKDLLQVPSLEQYKNAAKMANTKWYSMLTNKSDLNKKIRDIDPKDLNNLFTQLYKYAKMVKEKQSALLCNVDSKRIYGEITKPDNSKKTPPPKFDEYNFINEGKNYSVDETWKTVKIFLVENSGKKTKVFEYVKSEPRYEIPKDGRISKYAKDLNAVIESFGKYIKAESSNAIMLASQRYLSRLTEYNLSVSTNLDAYVRHQGFLDDYLHRMVRYIALVKQFIQDKSNQYKPLSEALYYGLYNNIDERNFNESVPEQATCQHVSKMGTKFAKIIASPFKFTAGLSAFAWNAYFTISLLLVYNPIFMASLATISIPVIYAANAIKNVGNVALISAIAAIGEDKINNAYKGIQKLSKFRKEINASRKLAKMQNQKKREIEELEIKTEKLQSKRDKKKRRTAKKTEAQ
jgi:hypothetical protein